MVLLAALPALAADWQKPTVEELSMTSQPEVPGADAVCLYREETTQDNESSNSDSLSQSGNSRNYSSVYVRLKILTEAGKRYGDVDIPFDDRYFSIGTVEGRTIHSDGTIVPFAGKPYQKVLDKTGSGQLGATVFSMPDVQVGSILEYRYILRFTSTHVIPPQWYVQQNVFLRAGHFYFKPSSATIITGHGDMSNGVLYSSFLPPGVSVKQIYSQNAFELVVKNIAPITFEEWAPPVQSLTYRVLFYYSGAQSATEYWATEGRYWSKDIDHFAAASPKVKDFVAEIVAPSDTDEQKVHKLYDAVMALDNTSFNRQHSEAENKAAGIRIKTADDIWDQKRGNDDEIALLFLAMVRAAGINAYAMAVTNRDHAIFWPIYLYMQQLDDIIVIVSIDGKEQYLDPGQRYCTFGQLNWKHSMSGGLRESPTGAVVAQTPGFGYQDAQVIRVAQLELGGDGKLRGLIKMKLTGPAALYWRQRALRTDEDAVKHEFEEDLQRSLPGGVEVKTNHFVALADWKSDLGVVMDVTGSMGTASAKHIFLPSSFFEASEKPKFAQDKREDSVDLHYPSVEQDTVVLTLPAGYTIESAPKDMLLPLAKNARYVVKYSTKPNSYTQVRQFVLANPFYDPKDYGDLRDFYQKVNAQDEQQMILTAGAGPAPGQ